MTNNIVFYKFVDFLYDLNEVFGNQMKSLKLFYTLVSSLQEKHKENPEKYDDQINKHVQTLKDFLVANKDAILSQNANLFTMKNLSCSDRIFIDFELVLRYSEEKSAIWKHLLLLLSISDPDGKAKQVLHSFLEEDTPENKVIKSIASKLEESKFADKMSEQNISNPMDMMQMLGSSGLLSSIMSSVNQSNLDQVDPKKLINTMRNMLDAISTQIDEQPKQ